ncbi:protein related to YOP1-Ypt-interacting [Pyrrhoderma noxium]|uniref:Protein YOP1 n=1 Tax=Pyrrhoderma noxium TaxID=2282107 RepID=A0A286UQ99_9AGAM|nr:protein related to YOP1-Ypt-interacting [Pyrrhoderma noxium]
MLLSRRRTENPLFAVDDSHHPSTTTQHTLSSFKSIASPSPMSAAQKVQQHPAFQQATDKANYYVGQLDKELSKYPILHSIEQRTQIPKAYAVIGAISALTLLLLVNSLAAPVSNLIGWGLPAYLSFKAIESPGVQDDVQWLTYWVVFGFFNFLESIALRAVLYYFPWYFATKTIFILWLQLPAFRGAQVIYFAFLKPVLANVKSPVVYQQPTTASADGLRDRVHTATTD